MGTLSFADAVEQLGRIGIRRHNIYFIDLVLLCEMAWADGTIQSAERELIFTYLNHHVDSINRLAGCRVVEYSEARSFVSAFMDRRPDPAVLDTIRNVMPPIRLENKDPDEASRTCLNILNACLDIAASSVTTYPYGLKERFTEEEKSYYHTLTRLLSGTRGSGTNIA